MSRVTGVELQPALPIRPPSGRYFDRERAVWVLSRYREVVAAFLAPGLWPVGTQGQDQSAGRDGSGRLRARSDFQRTFSATRVGEWQTQVEAISKSRIGVLDEERPFDLLGDLIAPVCLATALQIMNVDPVNREQVRALAEQVFSGAGTPRGSAARSAAEVAGRKLAEVFEGNAIPGGKQTFIGITQTLPRLVVNGLVALLQHSSEMARLRAEPHLMPSAVEELMRYAPTIHVISRLAVDDVEIDGLNIERGTQVNLMVASANRDSEQFPDPERLDVSRPPSSQVALGFGRDFCIGAVIVRMVYATITTEILRTFENIALAGPVVWQRRSESCWPTAVPVMARCAAHA